MAGVFGFLWSEFKDLERRLRELEQGFVLLAPVREHMHQKLQAEGLQFKGRR
jgi:hypothetical protein